MTTLRHSFTDHAARFKALAKADFDDLTVGELRELHGMLCDVIHVDDRRALRHLIDEVTA